MILRTLCAASFLGFASSAHAADGLELNNKGIHATALDGQFKARAYAVGQFDQRLYFGDSITGSGGDEFRTRRLRPYLDMRLYNLIGYRFMMDFAGPVDRVIDHYLELTPSPLFNLRVGKYKAPYGLEQLQADEALFFAERGLTANLLSFRDTGVMAYGSLLGKKLEYQLAVMNGNTDGNQFDANGDHNVDLIARFFATPWQGSGHKELEQLGFGLAASQGTHEGTASRALLPRYRTTGQQTLFSYSTGTFADGDGWRVMPQANYYRDALGLTAEYVISAQDYTRGANHAGLTHHAWQLVANYVLTGEKATAKSLEPLNPFSLEQKQWGAFELVARTGRLTFDEDSFPAFASTASSPRSVNDYGVGLNWYISHNLRFSLDYDINRFSGGAPAGADRPSEQFLVLRSQVKF